MVCVKWLYVEKFNNFLRIPCLIVSALPLEGIQDQFTDKGKHFRKVISDQQLKNSNTICISNDDFQTFLYSNRN